MKCSIVVAASKNWVIGRNNDLIWQLPRDLRFFMQLTMGMPILMGRKTFESLGCKPLKGRHHIIISRSFEFSHEQVSVFSKIEQGIEWARNGGYKELFITGGGTIYEYCLNNDLIDKVFLTTVQEDFEGDTFFKGFNKNDWRLISSAHYAQDEKNAHAMTFQQFVR